MFCKSATVWSGHVSKVVCQLVEQNTTELVYIVVKLTHCALQIFKSVESVESVIFHCITTKVLHFIQRNDMGNTSTRQPSNTSRV